MCSPDEGPRSTETSHLLIKSLELKCHAHIFYYLCYYIPIHGTRIYSIILLYIYIYYSIIYIIYIYINKTMRSNKSGEYMLVLVDATYLLLTN